MPAPADDRRDEQRARAIELADAHVCVARHFRPLFPSRVYVFAHIGGDDPYGKVDQSIVMDSFRLTSR